MTISGVAIGINAALLIIWTAVDPLQPSTQVLGQCLGNNTPFQNGIKIAFIAYNAILLLLGSILSFLTRNVNSSFNESKFIAFAVILTLSIFVTKRCTVF